MFSSSLVSLLRYDTLYGTHTCAYILILKVNFYQYFKKCQDLCFKLNNI